ncbi:MAG: C10 family peptidase [Lentimicrobiaceae bacterium]|nr:C10 family peptidase [Lentimicrobiaceae bacterium]
MNNKLIKYFALVLLIISSIYLKSETVGIDKIKTVALNFYKGRVDTYLNNKYSNVSIKEIEYIDGLYLVKFNPEGWAIISSSDKTKPILGYSYYDNYSEEVQNNAPFNDWIDRYRTQVKLIEDNNYNQIKSDVLEWDYYSNSCRMPNSTVESVEPLLTTKWNQLTPYNGMCPIDANGFGNRCVVGCVATAMAQVLHYFRFPETGEGSYSYVHPRYGTIEADFGNTTYNWYEIQSSPTGPSTELAKLNFHQGVAVDMDYGPQASGMWNHKTAFAFNSYFKALEGTRYYFRDSADVDWDSLVITNLNNRIPFYYAGWQSPNADGHAFVCDGYQDGNYYHFNWGWGGHHDGYFYTDNLAPGGYNFNYSQEIVNYFPDTVNYAYPFDVQSSVTLNNIRGSLEDGSGWYKYENNIQRTWNIKLIDAKYDSITAINFTTFRFDLGEGDTLYFLNNKTNEIVYKYHSDNHPPAGFRVYSDDVKVVFKTNDVGTANGFMFDYNIELPKYCGITTLTQPYGEISDGSGDKNYLNNTSCRWTVNVSTDKKLYFKFTSFNLPDSNDCVKIVDLSSQQAVGTFTGTEIPDVISLSGAKMMIMFTTNDSITGEGWSGYYYVSEHSAEKEKSLKLVKLYPNPAKDIINFEFYSPSAKKYNYSIIDINGRTYISDVIISSEGENKITINTSSLKQMAYFLIIIDEQSNVKKYPFIIAK